MLAATGFEVTDVSYERRLYGAYTCVKTGANPVTPGPAEQQAIARSGKDSHPR
jgi:hypothetical protein